MVWVGTLRGGGGVGRYVGGGGVRWGWGGRYVGGGGRYTSVVVFLGGGEGVGC